MQQPNETLEPLTESDDWGDFGGFIKQLETEESPTELTEETAPETEGLNDEALQGFMGVMFTLCEQATCIISGVEFSFDEKGKTEVINAAVPVLNKHGGSIMAVFGDYIEEATLLIAVLGLIYTSKRTIKELAMQKAEEEKRNVEKAKAAQPA
ncbi:hypothetical protein ACUALS_01645 [Vibrio sp. NH-7]